MINRNGIKALYSTADDLVAVDLAAPWPTVTVHDAVEAGRPGVALTVDTPLAAVRTVCRGPRPAARPPTSPPPATWHPAALRHRPSSEKQTTCPHLLHRLPAGGSPLAYACTATARGLARALGPRRRSAPRSAPPTASWTDPRGPARAAHRPVDEGRGRRPGGEHVTERSTLV
ncbi:MAG: hypothetical protein WKG07_25075, partial [Hymenobacter sp.]